MPSKSPNRRPARVSPNRIGTPATRGPGAGSPSGLIQIFGAGDTDGERSCCGFEILTLAPIDRRMIDLALPTTAERDRVDAYHARVPREIGPVLDRADADWLAGACTPLVAWRPDT